MKFSRPDSWSGWPFPSPGDLPNPGIKPRSPALQADSLPEESPGKPKNTGVGSLSLLQQIFPTQESNWGLLLCRSPYVTGFPSGSAVKNLPAVQEPQETWVQSLRREDPLEEKWQPTPVFLPGESHGQRSLADYSPWGCGINTQTCSLVLIPHSHY